MNAAEEWTPLATRFFRHPKVVVAGRDGALMFLASLCYCQEHLTDGAIPAGAVRLIAAESWTTARTAELLVDAGLWERQKDGYRIPGWTEWNRSRDEVDANREAERLRKQQWRRNRGVRNNGDATGTETSARQSRDGDATCLSPSTPTPTPTPTPDSLTSQTTDDLESVPSVVAETLEIVAERVAAEALDVRNPIRYRSGVLRRMQTERTADVEALHRRNPDWTAEQLADVIAPPPSSDGRSRAGARIAQTQAVIAEAGPDQRPEPAVVHSLLDQARRKGTASA